MMDPAYLARIGVYQDPVDMKYKRLRVRNANFEWDPSDPKAEQKGLLVGYDEQLIPYPVVLPLATDPDSIEEARQKAVASGADFHHPVHGWLRWGRKRETERPENLGAGTVQYRSRRVTVAAAQPPIPEPEPEPEPIPEPEPAAPVGRKGSPS